MPSKNTSDNELYDRLSGIKDPEIPFLSIVDLGILRDVQQHGTGVVVVIAPTYLACPATDSIEEDIRSTLFSSGYTDVRVVRQFKPPWTTDWITERGRVKMQHFGVSPPRQSSVKKSCSGDLPPICPRCGASESKCISEISGTLCKSLFRCEKCLEIYEQFKCL